MDCKRVSANFFLVLGGAILLFKYVSQEVSCYHLQREANCSFVVCLCVYVYTCLSE